MIFNKKIPPKCEYCLHGECISPNEIACKLHGIMSSEDKCRRFSYDPISRVPETPVSFSSKEYSEEDFSL